MAQVESLVSAESTASIARPAQAALNQEAKAEGITLPITTVTEIPSSQTNQENHLALKVKRESVTFKDDEVQFVFSVPKRRKKRRKGLEILRHSIGPDSCAMPPTLILSVGSSTDNRQIPASLPAVTRQNNHDGNERSTIPRDNQIPIHYNNGTYDHAPHLGMIAKSTYIAPTNSSSPPRTPWWDETTIQQKFAPAVNWRPLRMDDGVLPVQSFADGQEASAPTRFQYRQSEQISPRTNPALISKPTRRNTGSISFSNNIFGSTSQSLPATNSWPDFDWSMMESLNVHEYKPSRSSRPPLSQQQNMTTNLAFPHRVWPANSAQQYRSVYPPLSVLRQASSNQMHQGQFDRQSHVQVSNIDQSPPSQLPNFMQPKPVATTMSRSMSHEAPTMAAASTNNMPTMSRSPSDVPLSQVRSQPSDAVYFTPRKSFIHEQDTQRADLLRKPSLYSVPSWPYASAPSDVLMSASKPQSPGTYTYSGDGAARSLNNVSSASISRQPGQAALPATNTDTAPTPMQSLQRPTSKPIDYQIPDVRLGRKYSPNLIVDIAETCQACLPFAAIAERHSIPIQKVFDTFSAIIQLPLLRNADDRRRHGSLGKQRMKEYRDAKKAMEKAQEVERKKLMREMRGRVEEAGRRGRAANGMSSGGTGIGASGNGSGALLREAILNNVRGNQGGSS